MSFKQGLGVAKALAVHRVRADGDNEPDDADQKEGPEEEEGDGDGDFAGRSRTATWAAIPPTPLAPCEARFHSVRDDTIDGPFDPRTDVLLTSHEPTRRQVVRDAYSGSP